MQNRNYRKPTKTQARGYSNNRSQNQSNTKTNPFYIEALRYKKLKQFDKAIEQFNCIEPSNLTPIMKIIKARCFLNLPDFKSCIEILEPLLDLDINYNLRSEMFIGLGSAYLNLYRKDFNVVYKEKLTTLFNQLEVYCKSNPNYLFPILLRPVQIEFYEIIGDKIAANTCYHLAETEILNGSNKIEQNKKPDSLESDKFRFNKVAVRIDSLKSRYNGNNNISKYEQINLYNKFKASNVPNIFEIFEIANDPRYSYFREIFLQGLQNQDIRIIREVNYLKTGFLEAKIYELLGMTKEALAIFKDYFKKYGINKVNISSYLQYTFLLDKNGNSEKFEELLIDFLNNRELDAIKEPYYILQAYKQLTHHYIACCNYELATKYIDLGLEIDPKNSTLSSARNKILLALGYSDKANKGYGAIHKNNPSRIIEGHLEAKDMEQKSKVSDDSNSKPSLKKFRQYSSSHIDQDGDKEQSQRYSEIQLEMSKSKQASTKPPKIRNRLHKKHMAEQQKLVNSQPKPMDNVVREEIFTDLKEEFTPDVLLMTLEVEERRIEEHQSIIASKPSSTWCGFFAKAAVVISGVGLAYCAATYNASR